MLPHSWPRSRLVLVDYRSQVVGSHTTPAVNEYILEWDWHNRSLVYAMWLPSWSAHSFQLTKWMPWVDFWTFCTGPKKQSSGVLSWSSGLKLMHGWSENLHGNSIFGHYCSHLWQPGLWNLHLISFQKSKQCNTCRQTDLTTCWLSVINFNISSQERFSDAGGKQCSISPISEITWHVVEDDSLVTDPEIQNGVNLPYASI